MSGSLRLALFRYLWPLVLLFEAAHVPACRIVQCLVLVNSNLTMPMVQGRAGVRAEKCPDELCFVIVKLSIHDRARITVKTFLF